MDDHLEMDYEDRNGDPGLLADTISYPYYGDDDDDSDNEYDPDEDYLTYDSPSIEDTISEWPSYAN